MKRICTRCFKLRSIVSKLPEWTPRTHHMYDRKAKSMVLYFLMIFKSKVNLFHRLPKDVIYIIIKHVFSDIVGTQKLQSYCEPCMRIVYSKPPCQECLYLEITAPYVQQNYIYVNIDNEIITIPSICEKCSVVLYSCETHMNKTPSILCYKCSNSIKIQNAFDIF